MSKKKTLETMTPEERLDILENKRIQNRNARVRRSNRIAFLRLMSLILTVLGVVATAAISITLVYTAGLQGTPIWQAAPHAVMLGLLVLAPGLVVYASAYHDEGMCEAKNSEDRRDYETLRDKVYVLNAPQPTPETAKAG